jgi:hypothetical protein
MTTRRAFLGLAASVAASAALPRTAQPMRPTAQFYYDAANADEHSVCRVYCDTSVPFAPGTRPAVFTLLGGGWQPNGGTIDHGWTPTPGSLMERLYARGWAVIHMAYTVANTTTVNRGAFHHAYWKSYRGRLVIDEGTNSFRHQERDAVLAVQMLRYAGLREIPDLDLKPGSFYFHGRSAGGQAGCWLGFSADRADPHATRAIYRTSTLIGGIVQTQHIASVRAMKPGFQQYHLADSSGMVPTTVGQVPSHVHGQCWHLRWAHDQPKVPCFLSGDGTLYHSGPWDWASFQGVLTATQLHASDHVKATEQMPGHHPASVFLTGPVPATWDEDAEKWLVRLEESKG